MKALSILLIFLLSACTVSEYPDLVISNATIWSPHEFPNDYNTIIVKDGLIAEIGHNLPFDSGTTTKIVDAKGAFVMPGFIEGHGHFSGLGKSIQNIYLLNTKNWDEVLSMVKSKLETTPKGEWVEGRGWHQEKWDKSPPGSYHGYPTHKELSQLSPNNPLILYHASGHALFANEKAMELAGVSKETANPVGGEIVRDQNGEAIGVFEERAMAVIYDTYKEYLDNLPKAEQLKKWQESITLAEQECLKKGITSFQDAGSKIHEVKRYTEMATKGELDLRLWAMVRQTSAEMEAELANIVYMLSEIEPIE